MNKSTLKDKDVPRIEITKRDDNLPTIEFTSHDESLPTTEVINDESIPTIEIIRDDSTIEIIKDESLSRIEKNDLPIIEYHQTLDIGPRLLTVDRSDALSTFTFQDEVKIHFGELFRKLLNPLTWLWSKRSWIPLRHTPQIAGVLIPFVCLLSIPTLTENWVKIPKDDGTIQDIDTPQWLVISLGISLGFSVLANASIMLRFFEYHVVWTTWICIILLTLRDFIAIPTTIIWAFTIPSDIHIYAQGFWCTVATSILSFVVTFLLTFDFFRTPNFRNRGSGVTGKQRVLVIWAIIMVLTLAAGALMFSEFEEWSFIDGLFFSVCTVYTIGFGDLVPTTIATRIVLIFYGTFGIIIFAFAVTAGMQSILEGFQRGYETRRQRIKQKKNENRKAKTEVYNIREMQRRVKREEMDEIIIKLVTAFWSFIIFWFMSALVFHFTEDWTYFDSLYFCFVAFSTIGYGDFVPRSLAGRSFFIAFVLIGIGTLTYLLSVIAESVKYHMRNHVRKRELLKLGRHRHKMMRSQLLVHIKQFDRKVRQILYDQESIGQKDGLGPLGYDSGLLNNYNNSLNSLISSLELDLADVQFTESHFGTVSGNQPSEVYTPL